MLRAKADIIGEFLNKNPSKKVKQKVTKLAQNAGINLKNHGNSEELLCLKDTYRQKAKAKGARLRRYNELTKRKEQNFNFNNNRKKFFRELEKENVSSENINQDTGKFRHYWSSIWSTPKQYQKEANWIQEVEDRCVGLRPMDDVVFEPGDIAISLKKAANWKSPGPDKLHNFWLKYLTATHEPLARCFTEGLKDPDLIPKYLTEGTTFLLLKKGNPTELNNYRPIICLSVVYKLFTSLISQKIQDHCSINKLIGEEQKGCIKGALGCKHQLTIDAIVLKQAQVKKRNIHMCYIDYTKAFDSVPHDWLIKTLEIYKNHSKS